jgi:hypothetical protein
VLKASSPTEHGEFAMKLLAVLALASCMTAAHAVEEFGGIGLDSSITPEQVSILKKDLSYLYQNPVSINDEEFLATTKLQSGSGEQLHNFILNRVKYIVGENLSLESRIKKQSKLFWSYPKTPFPQIGQLKSVNQVRTVMTNIGGALYLGGKKDDILLGLEVDNETFVIKSPRIGILQVGEGLFYDGFLINAKNPASPSNSISRLGTLFHEARHSDGNGLSTGFVHTKCPAGHGYEGYYACELSGNGSYTTGGLAERQMTKNCTDCTTAEKTVLSAAIADSFDRVFDTTKAAKKASLVSELKTAKYMLDAYKSYPWPDVIKDKVNAEIKNLESQIAELEAQLVGMKITPDVKPASLDDAPEGTFKEISVEKSSKLMKASLKK